MSSCAVARTDRHHHRPLRLRAPPCQQREPPDPSHPTSSRTTRSSSSTGATPRPFPTPGGPSAASHPPLSPPAPLPSPAPFPPAAPGEAPPPSRDGSGFDAYALAGTALSLRGIPYVNGGTDPNGFDCSGFTQYVFSRYGLSLPREVREQYRVGKPIKAEDLAPGKQLIFAATGVTDGALMKGVRFFGEGTRTSSVIMTLRTGKVRFVESIHLDKNPDFKVRFS